MRRFYPLRCWPAVGGDQSGVNAVAMKFPAGIIVDALQAEIDAGASRDAGKDLYQVSEVVDQKVAHIASLHPTLI